MFDDVNFAALVEKYEQEAADLHGSLPADNSVTKKELALVVSLSKGLSLGLLGQKNPTSKKVLGYFGGVVGCFCQFYEVPPERNTDFLHAFFIGIFGSKDGYNLTNNFLYLHGQNDEETTLGTLEGIKASTSYWEDGNSKAFLGLSALD